MVAPFPERAAPNTARRWNIGSIAKQHRCAPNADVKGGIRVPMCLVPAIRATIALAVRMIATPAPAAILARESRIDKEYGHAAQSSLVLDELL